MILTKSDDEDLEENECIFMGHLEKETSACIAMTGCPGLEDVEFTIFSKHAGKSGVMKWSKDGSVELMDRAKLGVLRSVGLETSREDLDWIVDGDQLFLQEEVNSLMEIARECTDGQCGDEIQRTHLLKYQVNLVQLCIVGRLHDRFSFQLFFDDRFLAVHGTKPEARKQLKAILVSVF